MATSTSGVAWLPSPPRGCTHNKPVLLSSNRKLCAFLVFEQQHFLPVRIFRSGLFYGLYCIDRHFIIQVLGHMKVYFRTWARVHTYDYRLAALKVSRNQLVDMHGANILQTVTLCALIMRFPLTEGLGFESCLR